MSRSNTPPSPLVAAAAAVDDEIRGYADLARAAKKLTLDGEKALARAAQLLKDATDRQESVQARVRTLLEEINEARLRQEASLGALLEVAHALEARSARFQEMMVRFGELGESARVLNEGAIALAARKSDKDNEADLLPGLRDLEAKMADVTERAELLSKDAESEGWVDIARQATSIRQQVGAARNKLSLAQKSVAARAPS